jgi:hypothetical protein
LEAYMAKINKWVTIAAILSLILPLLILLVPAHTALANGGITPVYVNVATGNNAWSGAQPTGGAPNGPKKTIGEVDGGFAAVSSGGTVYVAAGTYPEYGLHFDKPFTLYGAGAASTIIDGGGIAWVMWAADEIDIRNLTIQNGSHGTGTGGLIVASAVEVYDCVIKNNTGRNGGGIGLDPGKRLDMYNCTVTGNRSPAGGYGGGGIYIGGSCTVTMTNCTISGNTASCDSPNGVGGGIFNSNTSTMTLTNCTIANNTANGSPGKGGGFYNGGTISFYNTIVANNTATGGNNNGLNESTVTSQGCNIDSENSCGFNQPSDKINTNPLLGPLQDNGGPTFTHALLHGSLAIDAANNAGAPATDQRGVPRPQGTTCDIGAYELAQASVATATGTGTASFSTINGYITGLTALAESALDCSPRDDLDFPWGLFSFTVTDITPGSTATIVIILPSNAPTDTQSWKCLNGQWVDCTSLLGSNDGDSVLTLTITDGGLGDRDGIKNGQISDPIGPAVIVVKVVKVVPLPPPAKQRVSPRTPASMSVQSLSINPKQAYANQSITITTNVVNTGGETGSLNVALKINGQVEQSRIVSVGPQGTQPVKFTVTKAQSGIYTVDIGGQQGSFTILGAGGSTAGTSSSDRMIGILIIIGALVLVTVLVVWLLIRRPA